MRLGQDLFPLCLNFMCHMCIPSSKVCIMCVSPTKSLWPVLGATLRPVCGHTPLNHSFSLSSPEESFTSRPSLVKVCCLVATKNTAETDAVCFTHTHTHTYTLYYIQALLCKGGAILGTLPKATAGFPLPLATPSCTESIGCSSQSEVGGGL